MAAGDRNWKAALATELAEYPEAVAMAWRVAAELSGMAAEKTGDEDDGVDPSAV